MQLLFSSGLVHFKLFLSAFEQWFVNWNLKSLCLPLTCTFVYALLQERHRQKDSAREFGSHPFMYWWNCGWRVCARCFLIHELYISDTIFVNVHHVIALFKGISSHPFVFVLGFLREGRRVKIWEVGTCQTLINKWLKRLFGDSSCSHWIWTGSVYPIAVFICFIVHWGWACHPSMLINNKEAKCIFPISLLKMLPSWLSLFK